MRVGDAALISMTFSGEHKLSGVDAAGVLRHWDLLPRWELGQVIGSPNGDSPFDDRITALAFSPDGEFLAVGGGEPSRIGELKIVSIRDGSVTKEIKDAHSDTVFGLAFSPDGKLLASCGADRFMKVFDVSTGALVKTFEGHTRPVLDVAWQADGRVLSTAGADKVVKVWDFNDETTDSDNPRVWQGSHCVGVCRGDEQILRHLRRSIALSLQYRRSS